MSRVKQHNKGSASLPDIMKAQARVAETLLEKDKMTNTDIAEELVHTLYEEGLMAEYVNFLNFMIKKERLQWGFYGLWLGATIVSIVVLVW